MIILRGYVIELHVTPFVTDKRYVAAGRSV